jgi:exosome complex component RRP41
MPKSNQVGLLQMDGSLTEAEFKQALDMAIEACKRIYEMQREALRTKYHFVREEDEGKEETSTVAPQAAAEVKP